MDHQQEHRAAAILVAAGNSTRMRQTAGGRKALAELGGKTVLEHCCAAFDATPSISEIVLVAHPEDLAQIQRMARELPAMVKVSAVLPGGAERTDSVSKGVDACAEEVELVAIHDGARPFVTPELIQRCVEIAAFRGAAVAALPLTDTVKLSADGGHVEKTLDRNVLWGAQTPQVFQRKRFLELLSKAKSQGFKPTDDAALWEVYVGPVPLAQGERLNFKLTTPEDLELARAILERRTQSESGA